MNRLQVQHPLNLDSSSARAVNRMMHFEVETLCSRIKVIEFQLQEAKMFSFLIFVGWGISKFQTQLKFMAVHVIVWYLVCTVLQVDM